MENFKEIVTIDETGLRLYTGLSSSQFANAKMGQYVTEPGSVFLPLENGEYKKTELYFTGTQSTIFKEVEMISVEIANFTGRTLYSYLFGAEDVSKKLEVIESLSKLVEWGFSQGLALQNCGPLGTVITDKNEIVLLPLNIYERSMYAQHHSATSEYFGCWTNGALDEVDSWRFTLASYAYTAITGKKAYPELVSEKRAVDYYDNNYTPLEYCVSVDTQEGKDLVSIIDYNLSLTKKSYQIIKPLKNSSTSKRIKDKVLSTERKNSKNSKVLPLSLDVKLEMLDNATLESTTERLLLKKRKKITQTRFIRKNATKILVAVGLIAIVGIIVGSIIHIQRNKPTTEGMTPVEVVETFYNSVSKLDGTVVMSCGENSAIKEYSNLSSSVLVTAKMKESYESAVEITTPGEWLNFDDPVPVPVFGFTNLDIDTKGAWRDNPAEGDKIDFIVTYYMIYSATEGYYEINLGEDALTLEYGKKYWQITDFETEKTLLEVDFTTFTKDLENARNIIRANTSIPVESQGVELVKLLQNDYPWLPSEKEISEAVREMPEQYFYPLPKIGF